MVNHYWISRRYWLRGSFFVGSKEDGFKINVKSQEAERGVMVSYYERNAVVSSIMSC